MRNEKIKRLKDYFERKPEVLLAFLFGSQAEGRPGKISDWDIAIYLKEKDLKTENKIWSDLGDILEKEVDLVVLNEAPSLLAGKIVREGIPLKMENENFFIDYFLKTTEEADYFLKFSHDYYQIYQKAKSLSETEKARLEKIFIFIENSLGEFEKFQKMDFEEYAEKIEKRRNIERWIESLMNSILDVSKIILASEKRPLPDTYKKILLESCFLFELNKNFRERLSDWIALRNIIAHEYLEVLWERIKDFLDNAKPYLEDFLKKAKGFKEGNLPKT